MPAYTPIRHFIDAIKDGETNITKRIKYLVMNYNHQDFPQAVRDLLDPNGPPGSWNNSWSIPNPVKDLLMHNGVLGNLSSQNKLSQDEVDHIDALGSVDKRNVLKWVDNAKGHADAQIWWELRREPPTHDDVVYDEVNTPLKIIARTWGGRVDLDWLGFNLGSIKYNKP